MYHFGISDYSVHRRRTMSHNQIASCVGPLESRTLLSGIAIYPQPLGMISPASVDDGPVEISRVGRDNNSQRVGVQRKAFDFRMKINYTISNSGSSPLEITLTALHVIESDGFAKEYIDKIPPQKTKQLKAKIGMQDLGIFGAEGRFSVTVLNGTQTVMNDILFAVYSDPPPSNDTGTKWGVKIYARQQLDMAFLNNQLVWSVNPQL